MRAPPAAHVDCGLASARSSERRRSAASLRRVQRFDALPLRGDDQFGLANARAQGVALRELRAHAAGELGDPRAHRRELGLRASACAESAARRAAAALRWPATDAADQCRAPQRAAKARDSWPGIHASRLSIQALWPLLYLRARKTQIVRAVMQRLFEFIGHHPYLAAARRCWPPCRGGYFELRERIQAFAALSATQAVRLMNQGALVIDLRSKELYDAGHIGDARNVPVGGTRIAGGHAEEMARQETSLLIATAAPAAPAPRAR